MVHHVLAKKNNVANLKAKIPIKQSFITKEGSLLPS